MGARILVHTGIAAGTVHWIERKVVRIGSDPIMEITIPSDQLAGHALTLEYRDGAYYVHNRSTEMVHLGGRTIAQNATDRWSDTDLLECSGAIQLALELDRDPAPTMRPMEDSRVAAAIPSDPNRSASKREVKSHETESTTKSNATMVQLAVIVVCVLLCGLLLIRDRLKQDDPTLSDMPTFQKVVQQGLNDDGLAESPLLRQFQYAESAIIRGNKTKARRWYGKVRLHLLNQQSKATEETPAAERDMLRWVEYRLAQLT